MRVAGLITFLVVAAAFALPARSQFPVSHLDPLWMQQAENHWYDEQIASGRDPVTLMFGLEDPLLAGSYSTGTLTELNRLFDSRPGDNDPEWNVLRNKVLLSLPLLRRGNGFQMLFRPQGDLYSTYLKRFAIHRFEELGHLDIPPGAIAIDTHVHTCFSHDSLADPVEMIRTAARRGLSGIAITDHNTMDGVRKALEALPRLKRDERLPETFFVIPGEEVSSSEGHIIGLYLKTPIDAGMSAARTVEEIHAQGGIAIAAHPLLSDGVGAAANTLPFDAVESNNGAEDLHFALAGHGWGKRADFYAKITKPHMGASDAHDPGALGAACTLLFGCAPNAEAVKQAILAGHTTAISREDAQTEAHNIGVGVPRLMFAVSSLFGSDQSGLSLKLKSITHADQARVTLLPRPWFYWEKRF